MYLANMMTKVGASSCLWIQKLLSREKKYSALEKECLAIVEGVKHYRVYLEGTKFRIETDNNPLRYLSSMKDNHGRVTRWYLALQPYSYEVVHRAGRLNGNADGLSRETVSNSKEGEMSENLLTEQMPDLWNRDMC